MLVNYFEKKHFPMGLQQQLWIGLHNWAELQMNWTNFNPATDNRITNYAWMLHSTLLNYYTWRFDTICYLKW